MEYSMLSRFQGGIIGSRIPCILAKEELESIKFPWDQICIHMIQELISDNSNFPTGDNLVQKPIQKQGELLKWKNQATISEIALATLPIGIFYHDNLEFLRKNLENKAAIWCDSSLNFDDLLIWGLAISLAMTEKFDGNKLISYLINIVKFINLVNLEENTLIQQLEILQNLNKNNTPYHQVISRLSRNQSHSQTPMALALYNFTRNPDDFQLCVKTAIMGGYQPKLTAALTGAISGVYNSFNSLNIPWHLATQTQPILLDASQLAKKLFWLWAGIYQPDKIKTENSDGIPCYPTGMIQKRK